MIKLNANGLKVEIGNDFVSKKGYGKYSAVKLSTEDGKTINLFIPYEQRNFFDVLMEKYDNVKK